MTDDQKETMIVTLAVAGAILYIAGVLVFAFFLISYFG